MPPELLITLLLATFPQYKLAELEEMEDVSPLLRAATLKGIWESSVQYKLHGTKAMDANVSAMIQYEAETLGMRADKAPSGAARVESSSSTLSADKEING